MINFFRHIRQNLLMENKTGKYLFYAIGEIILVVIGILIALSINNWNERAKNETILKVYLQNYVEDLRDDKKSMDNLSELNIFRYHALQHLLKLSGEDLYHSKSDNIEIRQISNNKRWNGPFPINYN